MKIQYSLLTLFLLLFFAMIEQSIVMHGVLCVGFSRWYTMNEQSDDDDDVGANHDEDEIYSV